MSESVLLLNLRNCSQPMLRVNCAGHILPKARVLQAREAPAVGDQLLAERFPTLYPGLTLRWVIRDNYKIGESQIPKPLRPQTKPKTACSKVYPTPHLAVLTSRPHSELAAGLSIRRSICNYILLAKPTTTTGRVKVLPAESTSRVMII